MLYLIVLVLSLLQVEKQLPENPSVLSPADIYSQFTPKQELKSILRRPSVEEKENKNSLEDELATTQQLAANIPGENEKKEELSSQKVSYQESLLWHLCSVSSFSIFLKYSVCLPVSSVHTHRQNVISEGPYSKNILAGLRSSNYPQRSPFTKKTGGKYCKPPAYFSGTVNGA